MQLILHLKLKLTNLSTLPWKGNKVKYKWKAEKRHLHHNCWDLQFVLFLFVHNPSLSLGLGINKQWIAGRLGYNNTVLYGQLIARQALQVPLTNLQTRITLRISFLFVKLHISVGENAIEPSPPQNCDIFCIRGSLFTYSTSFSPQYVSRMRSLMLTKSQIKNSIKLSLETRLHLQTEWGPKKSIFYPWN